MGALRWCIENQIEWREIDVALTGDGRVVVFHGDNLGGSTNGSGLIATKDYDEIKQLEIGKEESISLPRDFLCTAKSKVKLHIELKGIEHHKICELQKMIQDQKQFIVLHDETKSTWGKILECNLWILF